jgi:phosphatidylinositol phospholipase C epsilon
MLYQRRRAGVTANVRKKKKIQVARELSDLVIYCQSTKFKDFKGSDRSTIPTTESPLVAYRGGVGQPAVATFRNCYSIHENRAKSVGRKWPLRMLEFTEQHLIRCYPVGMRIDSSNFNPIPVWAVGVQMVALNYQTADLNMLLNTAFFGQNGGRGYVLKPSVMRSPDHILHRRFNPFSKELVGLHSMIIELTVVSGQYVCQQEYAASPVVEVEVLGIPTDCYKFKTKMSPRNSLNPIWEDTFEIEIQLPELAFLRFTVVDIATSVPTAQQVIPVRRLRPGYRNVALCDMKGQRLPLSALFILSVFHPDSLPRGEPPSEEHLQRKRMSFLVVHDVSEQDPYAILKVTSESTAQDVIRMALEKVGKANRVNEFVLVEEVGAGGPRDVAAGAGDQSPAHVTQRLVGMEENPLSVRSQWKADGKFVLRRVGEDPSWRARLMASGRERRVSSMPLQPPNFSRPMGDPVSSGGSSDLAQVPELAEGGPDAEAGSGEEGEADTFLVCIFNVSPGVAHTILRVPRISTAADVIATALNKSRGNTRLDPKNFVLVEETETVTTPADPRRRTGGSGKKQLVQRLLAEDENVYLVQSSWLGGGKLTLLEREKNLTRLRALDPHPSIRETQSDPCPRSSISGVPGSPRMRRPNNLVGRVRRFSRSLYADSPAHLEVVSDGDVTEDEEDGGRGRKSSIANFRKLKIW